MTAPTLTKPVRLLAMAAPLVAAGPTAAFAEEADAASVGAWDGDWSLTAYRAFLSRDQLGDMLLFGAELEDNYVDALALTRRLKRFGPDVDWEVEGQVARHGGSSMPSWSPVVLHQDHWELNALTSLRWNRFSWDHVVDTSLAAGVGVSWASELPEFEFYGHCYDPENPETPLCNTNRLMAYIMVEASFSLSQWPNWALVARIHHRSSMYGTFESDIEGASNAFGLGIKYRW